MVALVIASCVGGLTTGCTQVATGSATWVSDQASANVDKADGKDILLDPGEVGDVVGADLTDVLDRDSPFEDSVLEACEVFAGLGLASLAGNNWDSFDFRKLDDQPEEDTDADNYIAEAVIVYADADAAKTSFEDSSKMAQDCSGKERKSQESTWMPEVVDSTDDSMTWTDEQTDLQTSEWRCAGDVRRRNNVVLRALTCSSNRDQAENTAKIVDEMSKRVWESSAPK